MRRIFKIFQELFHRKPKQRCRHHERDEQSAWITGGVMVGQRLVLCGFVDNRANRVQINFLSGVLEFSEKEGALALRIDVNFQERYIAVTSFVGSKWHKRKKVRNPFKAGSQMKLLVWIRSTGFDICASEQLLLRYSHRMPTNNIDNVQIKGAISIVNVHLSGRRKSSVDCPLELIRNTPIVEPSTATYKRSLHQASKTGTSPEKKRNIRRENSLKECGGIRLLPMLPLISVSLIDFREARDLSVSLPSLKDSRDTLGTTPTLDEGLK